MASIITNMFCKTGAGGGVDPSCGKEGGGGGASGEGGTAHSLIKRGPGGHAREVKVVVPRDDSGGRGGHKERLDAQVAKASNVSVLRTPTGYKEFSKHGTVHYSHEGHITGFEPNKTSHEMRFGAKGKR